MKRVVFIDGKFGNKDKYVFREQYEDFGFYQEMCPSGLFVSQSYLITNGDVTIVIPSYNNCCKDEILDSIDSYKENGKFGFRMMNEGQNLYVVHPNGKEKL